MGRAAVVILAAAAALCACLPLAAAHGRLVVPIARNELTYRAGKQYCPHCFSAGGVSVVGANGAVWPAGTHGACGDPAAGELEGLHVQGSPWEADWRGRAVNYTVGSVASLRVVINAHHNGRFGFRICRFAVGADERSALTESCFDQNILVQAPGGQAPDHRFYYLETTPLNPVQPYEGGYVHDMNYQLPPGLACNGVDFKCVMQWHYVTGNNCNPPRGPDAPSWLTQGQWLQYPTAASSNCGVGMPYPEEFWNCADVRICPAGGCPGGSNPGPSPPLAPAPTAPSPAVPAFTAPSPAVPNTGGGSTPATFCKSEGWFADTNDACRTYFQCTGAGDGFGPLECTTGLLFNADNKACDFPDKVTCGPPVVPSPPSTNPAPVAPPSTQLPTAAPGGACGTDIARCPNTQCCSQWGSCGLTINHCGAGCQAALGVCTQTLPPPPPVKSPPPPPPSQGTQLPTAAPGGACGASTARCPDPQCCSKWGYCGLTVSHCGAGNCLAALGKCN